jgi:DNA repair exonuclease SbcCD ATPase subunit
VRDSEDRFLREERLKDELEIAKRQRLELEAALLDRDARAIENRFDLEGKEGEVERLRKRIRELEAAYRSAAAASGAKLGPASGADAASSGKAGVSSGAAAAQRERDLEGVIEAMKRVVDKLKAENDRLKKAGGGDSKAGAEAAEKRLAAEKKRADKAEEDLRGMQAKLKGHEESSQKLMQKQEQLTKLRKQLKQKDDELAAAQADGGDELDALRRKLQSSEARIQQLESSLQQADAKAARAGAGAGAGVQGQGQAASQQSAREVEALRKRSSEQAAELEALRADLSAAPRRAADLEKGTGAGAGAGAGGGAGAHPAALQAELRQLREENKNLRQELSAFDLDFF